MNSIVAGFFGFFNYTKPGRGISKDEPKKPHFIQFFILLQRKFWKIMQLNLIFLLFCAIPLAASLGIGFALVSPLEDWLAFMISIVICAPFISAALSGMTYILRNFANETPVFVFSDFWSTYKSNFKQSAAYGLFLAVIVLVMIMAWSFYYQSATTDAIMHLPAVLIILVGLVVLCANFYIYPMIVTLDLPLVSVVKNGILMTVLGIKANFFTLLFSGMLILAMWIFYIIGYVLYLLIGFALIDFIIVYNSYPIIQKYAIDPYIESQGGDSGEDKGEGIFNDDIGHGRT